MLSTKVWLLTLTAIMADGRPLTTNGHYATEAYCRASGMITADRLQSAGFAAGYRCDHIQLESRKLEDLISPDELLLILKLPAESSEASPAEPATTKSAAEPK